MSAARCKRYRRRILEISQQVQAAHVAPAFSCVEIVDALYNEVMRPWDIFIMSKGHGCLAQYVVLEDLGRLPTIELTLYCQPLGSLGAHPDYDTALGIHASTGSLGHGLGIAAGQALGERMRNTDARVYVLLSDGECQEGSTWEAAMVAANMQLDNLVALVDCNNFGGLERPTEAHKALYPLASKFAAFGWEAVDTEGHNTTDIVEDLNMRRVGVPNALVCHTTKGRGVSFMENSAIWHYRSPNAEEYAKALEELR